MLTVSLFRGSAKLDEKLIFNVPQDHNRRTLLMLAVIHEEGAFAGLENPRIMLYQNDDNPEFYWIRKETPGKGDQTEYTEFQCEDALTALGGFERATQLLLDKLLTQIDIDLLDQPAVPTIEQGIHSEASVRRQLS
jgi:hypothetical protein